MIKTLKYLTLLIAVLQIQIQPNCAKTINEIKRQLNRRDLKYSDRGLAFQWNVDKGKLTLGGNVWGNVNLNLSCLPKSMPRYLGKKWSTNILK